MINKLIEHLNDLIEDDIISNFTKKEKKLLHRIAKTMMEETLSESYQFPEESKIEIDDVKVIASKLAINYLGYNGKNLYVDSIVNSPDLRCGKYKDNDGNEHLLFYKESKESSTIDNCSRAYDSIFLTGNVCSHRSAKYDMKINDILGTDFDKNKYNVSYLTMISMIKIISHVNTPEMLISVFLAWINDEDKKL